MNDLSYRFLIGLAGALLCLSAMAGEAPQFCESSQAPFEFAPQTQAMVGSDGMDVQSWQADRDLLYGWLIDTHGMPGEAGVSAPLSQRDRFDLGLEDCDKCEAIRPFERRFLVGVNKHVGQSVDFAALPFARAMREATGFAGGIARPNADGLGWSATLSSPDASAVRLNFRQVQLPADSALFIYNDRGEAYGPYVGTSQGELWSHTVSGDHITVAVQFFGKVDRATVAQARFQIAEIVHLGPDFLLAASLSPDPHSGNGHCSNNEPCVEDASCYGTNDFARIDDVRNAVAAMLFSSGPWAYLCSGGLLADTISSETPYFLTANHCISRGREANSLEAYFRYMTSSCGATCPSRGGFPRTVGSSILSTNKTSDYTLLQLSEQPPSGSVFLGWTSSEVASSHNHELYRISHPRGSPQAFSTHYVDTSRPTCSSWPRGPWIYSSDVIGATEGGSSGSPVLNAQGQVVGTLSGACGFNVNDVCDSVSNATVDGALAYFFNDISQWLAPDGGGDPDPGDPDPGEPGTISVASIQLSVRAQGPWRTGQATVTIRDQDGNPVGGATVSGSFSGDVSGSSSGTTGSNGQVQLDSNRVRQNSISFTFCVTGVSHPDKEFDGNLPCQSN